MRREGDLYMLIKANAFLIRSKPLDIAHKAEGFQILLGIFLLRL